MNIRIFQFVRWLPIAVLMLAGSACNLPIATRPAVNPQFIVVTATLTTGNPEPFLPSSTLEPTLTQTSTATLTPTLTATSTTPPVTMTAGQTLSCVKGPQWILYGWVAGIAKGETVTLLAKASPEWEEYYYVRKSDGTECWAFGGSSTKSGSTSGLSEMEAPPLPVVTYQIDNKTGLTVCDVFIRGKDETIWGADRLGAGTIAPGASFSLTITAGFYDVLIRDCYAAPLYEKQDRPIGSEADYHYTLLNNQVEFYIQNNHAFNLCWIYFKPAGGAWKAVHTVADGAITPGSKAYITILVGMYDLAIYNCSGGVADNLPGAYIGPTLTGFGVPYKSRGTGWIRRDSPVSPSRQSRIPSG